MTPDHKMDRCTYLPSIGSSYTSPSTGCAAKFLMIAAVERRAASVEATTKLKVFVLARDRFVEILGPLYTLMAREKSPAVVTQRLMKLQTKVGTDLCEKCGAPLHAGWMCRAGCAGPRSQVGWYDGVVLTRRAFSCYQAEDQGLHTLLPELPYYMGAARLPF